MGLGRILSRGRGAPPPPAGTKAAASGGQARPAPPTTPGMETYRDIAVVPPCEFYANHLLVDGGPVWPDFDRANAARYRRNGRLIDRLPAAPEGPVETIETPCVWGGYAIRHFGHLVGEQMTRLAVSVCERPDDLYLFVLRPGEGPEAAPAAFWQIMEWYGIPRDRIRFVERPLLCRELRVAAQGETLDAARPTPEHLDALETVTARAGLEPRAADTIYVTRAGMHARGQGGFAGESYLTALMPALGVPVLDPAATPLRAQLEAYAGARRIIFAEGSAIHGRQLLGRLDQEIVVLKRRPWAELGYQMMSPRCRRALYMNVVEQVLPAQDKGGADVPPRALSLYDTGLLFDVMRGMGLDLAPHWNDADYARHMKDDAAAWIAAVRNDRIDRPLNPNVPVVRAGLARYGLQDLLGPPAR